MIFFGSSTKEGKFNGIGAVLSNRQDKEAFVFLFDFVKDTAEPSPIAVMDNADTSSVRDKLPQAKRLTCYFHVIKNVRQRLSKVRSTDQAVYNKIFEDFMTLQASAIDEESFTILYSMFVNKWLREHIFYDPELKQMVEVIDRHSASQ